MKVGARNNIIGTVKSIKKGSLMTLVKVEIPKSQVSSVMTLESLDEMQLKEGDQVSIVIKGVNVLLLK